MDSMSISVNANPAMRARGVKLRKTNAKVIHANIQESVTRTSTHTLVSALKVTRERIVKPTLMIVNTNPVKMEAHVLTMSTTSAAYVMPHLQERPVKLKWTHALLTCVPMGLLVHPLPTTEITAAPAL